VIAGKDASLVSLECQKLLDELLPAEDRPAALFDANPKQATISEVLDELRTLPFLADTRIVLIKGADKFISANRSALENYFDNPVATGILIMTVDSLPSNTNLAKKLKKVGELISITAPKGYQLTQRLVSYAHDAHDKNLNKTAAELVVEFAGENLPQLYSEIDKLALFVHPQKIITPKHVESLTGHNRLFNVFNVIDCAIEGNCASAIEHLRKMFEADRSVEYTFLGAFAFHMRRMFNAKALLDKGLPPQQIANQLRIWGNKQAFFAQLRKVTLKQLAQNLMQIAETDHAIKTGQTKPKVAAEQLIFKMAGT
jgi:DNA polymerase-3 subunit delta